MSFRAHDPARPVCDCPDFPGSGEATTRTHSLGSIVASAQSRTRSLRQMLTAWAEADLMVKRTRHQWAPWATAALALSLAATHELAALLTRDPAATAYSVGGVAVLTAVAADAIRAQRRWMPWLHAPAQRRAWAQLCLVAGTTWTVLAFLLGLSWDLTAVLAVGTAVLARRHWAAHRIPDPEPPRELPPPTPAPEPAPPDPDEDEEAPSPDQVAAYWDANVAPAGGPIPYSSLTPIEVITTTVESEDGEVETEIGTRYLIALADTSGVTIEAAVAAIPAIAQAIHTPRTHIIIEEFPPTEADPTPDPNYLKMEVITNSPIAKPVKIKGPRYRRRDRVDEDSGQSYIESHIDCGPYANGDGQSAWRVYSRDSLWGGFILGGIGSGKSALMNLIALSLLASGHTALWYIDGQNEASSAFLAHFADWSASGPDDWEPMLAALEEIASARADYNADQGVKGFTPSPEMPGLVVIVDECQFVFHPDTAKRWESLARIGRKVGISIIAATQAAQIDSFGGLSPLKDALEAGNCKVLRCTGKVQQHLVSGLNMDPTTLPEIPGYGYSVASGLDGFGRTAAFRSGYHDNYTALAEELGLQSCPLDALSQGAANVGSNNRYAIRHASREDNREQRRARLEAYRAAAEGAGEDTPARALGAPRGLFDTAVADLAPAPADGAGVLPDDIGAYMQQLADSLDEPAAPGRWGPGMNVDDVLGVLGEVHHKAFTVIADAHAEGRVAASAEIQTGVGKGKSRTHEIVRDLVNHGLVSGQGRNRWSLSTGAAAERDPEPAPA